MKIYLRNKQNFSKPAQDFYEQNFELVSESEAECIVINSFEPASYPNKIVAFNATCPDNVTAKEIISLRGEDLSDLTSVAELTICMAGYLMRIFKGEELKGKTLGVLGYGRIGKQVAKYAENFGMKVKWTDFFDEVGKKSQSFQEDLIDTLNSDVVSLHITSDNENSEWFNRKKFAMMKDKAIFLNASRPFLVNREDFAWALENKLGGAWEDFYTPLTESINKYNLVCTNHIGGGTVQSKVKTELILARKLYSLYGKK